MRSCLHLNPLQHPRRGEISAGSHSSAPSSPGTKGITPPESTILLQSSCPAKQSGNLMLPRALRSSEQSTALSQSLNVAKKWEKNK